MSLRTILGDWVRSLKLGSRKDDRAELERLIPLLRKPRQQPGTLVWQGLPIHYADGASLYYQLAEIFEQRVYDFSTSLSAPRILDVGGNIGIAVRRFRRIFPQANITTFEPDPALAKILRRNLAAADDVKTRVIEAAAWTKSGMVGFNPTGNDSGSISIEHNHQLPCCDIIEFLDERVDFMKLDVEGAEYDLLAHMHEAGSLSQIDRLFVELHHWPDAGTPVRFHEALQIIAAAKFEYRITTAEVFGSFQAYYDQPHAGNQLTIQAWRASSISSAP
jgi:FkbM family methyltransferase